MTRQIDETGNTYDRLTVVKQAKATGSGTLWLCRCACGRRLKRLGYILRQKHSQGQAQACPRCLKEKK